MPTYDYVCDSCEHQFEHRQSMTSNRLRTYPQCKKRKLRRLIGSGAGVIFKGSGFYETDYKRKSRGDSKDKDRDSEKKSESASTTSESKSDAKKKDGADKGDSKSKSESTSKKGDD